MSMLSSFAYEEERLMARSCRGVCCQFEGKSVRNGLRYSLGQKRCTFCGLFMDTESIRCPCCSAILRTKSRS